MLGRTALAAVLAAGLGVLPLVAQDEPHSPHHPTPPTASTRPRDTPPRMMPWQGFVDTGLVFGPSPYGKGSLFSGVANQLAAMPSMHFGWAVVVAWATIKATRTRWRFLVVVHPVLTLAAIVLTANHFWMDAIVAGVLFAVSLRICARWERRKVAEPAISPASVPVPGS